MSLKNASTPSEYAKLLEDLENGKEDVPSRLYKYVEQGTISPRRYDELIEVYGAIRRGEGPSINTPNLPTPKKTKVSGKTKKLLILGAIILALVLAAIITASAHSGRTDANGGHRDNSNQSGLGYYHYHCGGYPAHLHYGGSCPYKTKVYSSGSSVKTTSKYDEGYDDGYDEGYDKGYDEGYDIGYDKGYDSGHQFGHAEGYNEGKKYKSPHDIALMIYAPISIIAILILCIKAFKR